MNARTIRLKVPTPNTRSLELNGVILRIEGLINPTIIAKKTMPPSIDRNPIIVFVPKINQMAIMNPIIHLKDSPKKFLLGFVNRTPHLAHLNAVSLTSVEHFGQFLRAILSSLLEFLLGFVNRTPHLGHLNAVSLTSVEHFGQFLRAILSSIIRSVSSEQMDRSECASYWMRAFLE